MTASLADIATVVDREVAWLTYTGDTLPTLVKPAGLTDASAPFDVIDAYIPIPIGDARSVRVTITSSLVVPIASARMQARHAMRLHVRWPLSGDSSQVAQKALTAACALLVQRIVGPARDKSHGGRFQAAADDKVGNPGVRVTYLDPITAHERGVALSADVLYQIDDFEVEA